MGGTLNSIYNNTSFALNLHYEAMARLQEQAYTGSRINRASDDPSMAYRVLGLNSQQKLMENYMDNISRADTVLDVSASVIMSMTEAIVKAKESLTQILSGTYNESQRDISAGEINEILEHMVSLANKELSGQYLFGGGNTSTAPYTVQRTNGEIISVTYQGSFQQRNIQVAPGVQSNAYHIGEDLFCSDNRSTPVFVGDTGAAAGSGTSSVKGDVWLTVADAVNEKQTITITGGTPTSGNINIAFGATPPLSVNVGYHATAAEVETALETLGSIGDVTCTGNFLDDANGITIEFAGALALTNVAEMVVTNVDLDAGAPAISTDRDGGMQLSIDEGTAVGIPIGDKSNVAVTSPDGKVLYVNATNINSTGVDMVTVPGTYNIFDTLISTRDLLKNERGFSDTQLSQYRNKLIDSLEEVRALLVGKETSMGSKMQFINDLKNSLEDMKLNITDEATLLQEADIAQVAIDISRREVLYQMSLSVAAKLMSMSLLDFIR
jgi:flagellar hook-associated protein 3